MTLPGGRFADRFWAKVQKGAGCWEWQASRTTHGYGQMSVFRRPRGAHRVSWELNFGPIPEGLFVCHHCDNPPCVRPDHLYLGTSGENTRDAAAHGLTYITKGEANNRAKLTRVQVDEMRRLHLADGVSYSRLAEQFGIRKINVWRICTGKAWTE